MEGTPLSGKFAMTTLRGDSPDAYNDIDAPERVIPVSTDMIIEDGIIALPPHAVSVIRQG
jgi:alpha-L-arabinofuranosidase